MLQLSTSAILETTDQGSGLPVSEVAVALSAAAGSVERATAEPDIQTVLDNVRRLTVVTNNRDTSMEEKLTPIKRVATSIGSYSSVAGYPSYASVRRTPFGRGVGRGGGECSSQHAGLNGVAGREGGVVACCLMLYVCDFLFDDCL